jgi:hypothetical protein
MIKSEIPINGSARPGVIVGKDWFRFFANVWTWLIRGSNDAALVLSAGASPYVYQATVRGQLVVSGGTVSAIALSRDGTNYYTTGETAGVFAMSFGDRIKITHTGAPTTFVFLPL